jgi:hypothetical protein
MLNAQVDDLEIRTVVCALVPAKNASALIALLSAHLPIPDLKFLKRVRAPRVGEYPDLFSAEVQTGGGEREREQSPAGADRAASSNTSGGGGKRGGPGGSEKLLLAMIGPQALVTQLQEEDGGVVYSKLLALCTRFFDGRIPAFPPNTRDQFDAWSQVAPSPLTCRL